MSQQMKKVMLDLLAKHGFKEAFEQAQGGEFHLRLDNGAYMPLVIEKIAGDQVSIAHYGEQYGDLMKDPEMVFRVQGDEWQPFSFENSYTGTYQEVYVEQDGTEMYYPRLKRELTSFAATWAKNLREQGWLKDGVTASSLTHQWVLDGIVPAGGKTGPDIPEQAEGYTRSVSLPKDAHLEGDYESRNGGDVDSGE